MSIAIGFGLAKVRTSFLDTTMLNEKHKNAHFKACIHDVEQKKMENHYKLRLVFDHVESEQKLPVKLRLNLKLKENDPLRFIIKPGVCAEVKANLLPLSDPVSPQGYQFRRQAYFQGIGGVGQIKDIKIFDAESSRKAFGTILQKWRHDLTQELRTRIPGTSGEIAAAIVTGDRSGIPNVVRQNFADAGLAHILAISGLHLSLVAGLIFLIVRRGLSFGLAELCPIKKWAAVIVILATACYLAISGFGFPAQRAFVMTSLIMVGILIDRNPLSMRSVAIAASLILVVWPESILSASFQLSFAAVVALIAVYEGGWNPLKKWSLQGRWYRRVLIYFFGVILTTLVATVATTPFTIALFNRFTLQAILANLLAIPLTGLVIMPAAMLSVFSLSWGGVDLAYSFWQWGLDLLIAIAYWVSKMPGAAILVPTPSTLSMFCITMGGLWICLWRYSWRYFGLVSIGIGCFFSFFQNLPDVFSAGDGSVIAYRQKDVLYVSSLTKGAFFTDCWMKELGIAKKEQWPSLLVVLRAENPVILVADFWKNSDLILQLKNVCKNNVTVISNAYLKKRCRKLPEEQLIDRDNLKREGTHLFWFDSPHIKKISLTSYFANRPWSLP